MAAEEKLKQLQEIVNLQAEDPILWAISFDKPQTIQEAYLQSALRYLHHLIEESDE